MLDGTRGAGAGIHCELFNFYLPIGPCATAFDGEIEAITVAIQQLSIRKHSFERAVILSDSKSALQALLNKQNNSQRILECKSLLKVLVHRISFQWIPAHCGILGNEKADALAKKGALIEQCINRPLSFHSTKLYVNLIHRKTVKWNMTQGAGDRRWKILGDEKIIPGFPRKTAVALFRGLTGHDCLQNHLCRISVVDSPDCVLCDSGQPMTFEHLNYCDVLFQYEDIVKKYWRARELMA